MRKPIKVVEVLNCLAPSTTIWKTLDESCFSLHHAGGSNAQIIIPEAGYFDVQVCPEVEAVSAHRCDGHGGHDCKDNQEPMLIPAR